MNCVDYVFGVFIDDAHSLPKCRYKWWNWCRVWPNWLLRYLLRFGRDQVYFILFCGDDLLGKLLLNVAIEGVTLTLKYINLNLAK